MRFMKEELTRLYQETVLPRELDLPIPKDKQKRIVELEEQIVFKEFFPSLKNSLKLLLASFRHNVNFYLKYDGEKKGITIKELGCRPKTGDADVQKLFDKVKDEYQPTLQVLNINLELFVSFSHVLKKSEIYLIDRNSEPNKRKTKHRIKVIDTLFRGIFFNYLETIYSVKSYSVRAYAHYWGLDSNMQFKSILFENSEVGHPEERMRQDTDEAAQLREVLVKRDNKWVTSRDLYFNSIKELSEFIMVDDNQWVDFSGIPLETNINKFHEDILFAFKIDKLSI